MSTPITSSKALTGHAKPTDDVIDVRVSDVVSYVDRKVPLTVADMKRTQTPDVHLMGNFPVALLIGGKGVAKGVDAPDPLDELPPQQAVNQYVNSGSGGMAIGDGNVVSGEGGISAGRDAIGNQVVHGSHNQARQINTDGGTYIEDNSKTEIEDQYNIGEMSGNTGVAIGRGAKTEVNQGVTKPQQRFCVECGSELVEKAKFCSACGTSKEGIAAGRDATGNAIITGNDNETRQINIERGNYIERSPSIEIDEQNQESTSGIHTFGCIWL